MQTVHDQGLDVAAITRSLVTPHTPERSPGPRSALPTHRHLGPGGGQRGAAARHLHNQDRETGEIAPESSCLLRHSEPAALSLTTVSRHRLRLRRHNEDDQHTREGSSCAGREQGSISLPYPARSECSRQAGWGEPDGPDSWPLIFALLPVVSRYAQEALFNRQHTDTMMTIVAERLAVIAAITLAITSLSSVRA
jgi:hypothetical protein